MSHREEEDGMGFAGFDPAMTPEERHIERLEKELRRKQNQCGALVAALDTLMERIISDNSPLCMTPEYEAARAALAKVRP